jgi:HEPN domain-containing protein
MQRYEEWLCIATDDLDSSKILFQNERFNTASYHAHQCAEKALKGYLSYKLQNIRKTHELIELLKDCFEFDPEFWKLYPATKILNPFATKFRYPGDALYPDESDVKELIKNSEEILNFVKKKIKP